MCGPAGEDLGTASLFHCAVKMTFCYSCTSGLARASDPAGCLVECWNVRWAVVNDLRSERILSDFYHIRANWRLSDLKGKLPPWLTGRA